MTNLARTPGRLDRAPTQVHRSSSRRAACPLISPSRSSGVPSCAGCATRRIGSSGERRLCERSSSSWAELRISTIIPPPKPLAPRWSGSNAGPLPGRRPRAKHAPPKHARPPRRPTASSAAPACARATGIAAGPERNVEGFWWSAAREVLHALNHEQSANLSERETTRHCSHARQRPRHACADRYRYTFVDRMANPSRLACD
eukprot:scaffold26588_cov69-Phaeocystis_antarctica.AAC.4